jgi:carbamate kinase
MKKETLEMVKQAYKIESECIATMLDYLDEEQFAKGSMLPKVEAAMRFASSGEGRSALITLLDKAKDGIDGKTGTVIHI